MNLARVIWRITDAVSRQLSAHRLTTRQEFLVSYVQQGRAGEEGGKARMLRVLIGAGARPPLATPHPRSGCVYTERGECTLWIVT